MSLNATKTITEVLQGREISVQSVDFADKHLLFVRVDGEADTTFDVKAPDANTMLQLQLGGQSAAEDFTCEKTCLIGQNTNLKLGIAVNQIAKVLYTNSESRNLVISISSKLFASPSSGNEFETLVDLLQLVKRVIT
ncbi:Proteasome chaperone 3 [Cyberlindnera fabianii]|uniref:Proteasome chaperone 3 n=1 Tax=Cyberlindnera fabianii TaxID=36022 RepID=A0A1V2LB26_CYBFA|nr:Proteasome chaperone 3 [Cyberlindnera fabianii]